MDGLFTWFDRFGWALVWLVGAASAWITLSAVMLRLLPGELLGMWSRNLGILQGWVDRLNTALAHEQLGFLVSAVCVGLIIFCLMMSVRELDDYYAETLAQHSGRSPIVCIANGSCFRYRRLSLAHGNYGSCRRDCDRKYCTSPE